MGPVRRTKKFSPSHCGTLSVSNSSTLSASRLDTDNVNAAIDTKFSQSYVKRTHVPRKCRYHLFCLYRIVFWHSPRSRVISAIAAKGFRELLLSLALLVAASVNQCSASSIPPSYNICFVHCFANTNSVIKRACIAKVFSRVHRLEILLHAYLCKYQFCNQAAMLC